MALGGVATGSMKAKLHPIALPKTGGTGFTDAALDTAMIIGMIMFADAVLDVTSVRNTLRATESKVIRVKLAASPPKEIKNVPMASARPVSNI